MPTKNNPFLKKESKPKLKPLEELALEVPSEIALDNLEREIKDLKEIIDILQSDNEILKDTIVKLTVERVLHSNER